jgi:N-acyl-D-amino-acid deacylase
MNLCLSLAVFAANGTAAGYDTVIRHGRIVDGTGNPAFFADLAIRDQRIARIGKVTETGKTEIDAQGLIVAPGFIDVHTHADDIAAMPLAENFVRMGVTTVVVGNCGSSTLDAGRFFEELNQAGVCINVATLVGHNDVRRKAMGGSHDRPPSPAEMEAMKALVERAMKEGALGLSTGLIYLPGTFSTTEEIIELAKVAASYGGIYASHMRHEDTRIQSAIKEVIQVAREAHLRAHISHIKLAGPSAWGQANQVLEQIENSRREGLDLTQDQYAYTASSTSISQLIPDSALDGGRDKFLERLADPKQKSAMLDWMKKSLQSKGRTNYAYAVIASCRHDPKLNGLNIPQAAKLKRGSDSLEDQLELILELQQKGGATGVFHGMSEDDLKTFMRHPNTAVACDSGLRKFGEGVPHPRGYGNNARVLGRYVRELKVLRLEDAIRKMTSLPASTFRFQGRGLIREGNWADITIFDAEKVKDNSAYDDPHHYASGIPYVLVNGTLVLDREQHTHARAGQGLKGGGRE